MFGWCGRLLRVNLTDGAIARESLDPEAARTFLGGRGLGTRLHAKEVSSSCEPLGAANHLVFITGPLTGTVAPNGGRYTVVTRVPPEGSIAAASISGKWGSELKFAGFDGIIVEGRAAEPSYLWIKDGHAELRSAARVWGKPVRETTDLLVAETHERSVVSCIGPAGENGVKGSVIVSDYFSAAGGAGAGRVMGSKNLKAIVVCGTIGFRAADHRRFLKLATEFRTWMKTKPIAARGVRLHDCFLRADSVAWDAAAPESRPARTRGCFGCATSFSSFTFDDKVRALPLLAGSPPAELGERLREYRHFADLGLDFVAAKTSLASLGKEAEADPAGFARKLAAGEMEGTGSINGNRAMDRGACFASGYAVAPNISQGNGQDRALSCLVSILDSAGLCPFLAAGIETGTIAGLLNAATGIDFSQEEILQAGQRISLPGNTD